MIISHMQTHDTCSLNALLNLGTQDKKVFFGNYWTKYNLRDFFSLSQEEKMLHNSKQLT